LKPREHLIQRTLIVGLVTLATLAALPAEAAYARNGMSLNGTAGNGNSVNGTFLNGLVMNGYKLRGSLRVTGGDHHGGGVTIQTITLADGTRLSLN